MKNRIHFRFYISLLFFELLCFAAKAQNRTVFFTHPYQSDIRSLQILPNNRWGELPLLNLESSDYLIFSFDQINTSSAERFRYKIIYCNADWTPSSLLDIEYLNGFNDNLVDDYAFSQATSINYVNYRIQFPNDDVRAKLSGNYVLEVYREDDPSDVVLTACFYILDKQVNVSSQVSSNTDRGINKGLQQVSFSLSPINLHIRDPYADIQTVVMQNRRRDNEKVDIQPTFLNGDQLIYEHNQKLIFNAGNEYRRFQFVSIKSGGMNVDRFRFDGQNYQVWLNEDKIRAERSYIYDQDQDGKFLIRNYDGNDADTDADYALVHFSLKVDQPLLRKVYLAGDFTYGYLNPDFEMKYNSLEKTYSYTTLLKLGSYNYMYVCNEDGEASGALTEGSYYQAENEYLTFVYYRPIGQHYDSLIGYSVVKFQ